MTGNPCFHGCPILFFLLLYLLFGYFAYSAICSHMLGLHTFKSLYYMTSAQVKYLFNDFGALVLRFVDYCIRYVLNCFVTSK